MYIDAQEEDEIQNLKDEIDVLKTEIHAFRAEKKLRQGKQPEGSDLEKISDGKCCCMLSSTDLSAGYDVELTYLQVMISLQGGVLPSKVTSHKIWNGRAMVLGCIFLRMCSLLMSPKAR